MQEHFHFTTDPTKLPKQYAAIFCFVSAQLSLIQMYLHRRNRHLVKQKTRWSLRFTFWGSYWSFLPNDPGTALSSEICSLMASFSNVLGTIAAAAHLTLWSNGFVMNGRNVGNIMFMPSSTVCLFRCAIPRECSASSDFEESQIWGAVLPKSNGTTDSSCIFVGETFPTPLSAIRTAFLAPCVGVGLLTSCTREHSAGTLLPPFIKTFASVKAIFINAQRKCYNA